MADTLTIKCAECGHVNEPERVYCHNCGAKLDRSLLPKPADKKENAEEARKRYNKMVNPGSNWAVRDAKTLCKVLVGAALVASLGLYCMPPENAPERAEEIGTMQIRDLWSSQMEAPGITAVNYTEASANSYLKTLKADDGFVKYKGAFVKFSPGVITFYVKREISGFPMWSSVDYKPVVKDGKFLPQVIGVHYGRLGIDPIAAFAQDWGVGPVLKVLQPSFKGLDRIGAIEVAEGRVTITTKPQ